MCSWDIIISLNIITTKYKTIGTESGKDPFKFNYYTLINNVTKYTITL